MNKGRHERCVSFAYRLVARCVSKFYRNPKYPCVLAKQDTDITIMILRLLLRFHKQLFLHHGHAKDGKSIIVIMINLAFQSQLHTYNPADNDCNITNHGDLYISS
jgi:hypothetical protein